MTVSGAERAELFRKFDSVLGERIERIFEQSMLGEIEWSKDRWSALLDWIEGPLRKKMYSSWKEMNPDQPIEQAPSYMAFEAFDRARLQGSLDDGPTVRILFSAVRELVQFENEGLKFFDVKFKPPEI